MLQNGPLRGGFHQQSEEGFFHMRLHSISPSQPLRHVPTVLWGAHPWQCNRNCVLVGNEATGCTSLKSLWFWKEISNDI